MICPRCGRDNPIPEATKNKCIQCGFSLLGEVPRADIRRHVRRKALFGILLVLAVICATSWYAWPREWFGLFGSRDFVASDRPTITPLFAAGFITVAVNGVDVPFSRDAAWQVDAVVLANSTPTAGSQTSFAVRDLVLVWGEGSRINRKSVSVASQDGRWTVKSSDSLVEPPLLGNTTAVVHVIPSDASIASAVAALQPGAKVGLNGYLISATINGNALSSTVAGNGADVPTEYLVYLTSVTRGGKPVSK